MLGIEVAQYSEERARELDEDYADVANVGADAADKRDPKGYDKVWRDSYKKMALADNYGQMDAFNIITRELGKAVNDEDAMKLFMLEGEGGTGIA